MGVPLELAKHRLRVHPSRSMRTVTAEIDALLGAPRRAEAPGGALLASELIAQVVGCDPRFRNDVVDLTIELREDAVRMEASGPAAFSARAASDAGAPTDALADWGPFILDRLADRWGVREGARPAIWAEIDRPALALP